MDTFIQQLAVGAGKIVASKFKKIRSVRTKAHGRDYVTEADLAADAFIVNAIHRRYPKHKIISEERPNEALTDEYTWIIDPLDGTFSFVNQIPFFVTSIALAHKKKVILAALYDPVHKDLYFAKKGGGAYVNGRRIAAIRKKHLHEAAGSFLFTRNYPNRIKTSMAVYKSFFDNDIYMLRGHSVALMSAYVASGKTDLIIAGTFPLWDLAAAGLILRESGLKVTDFKGKPWTLEARQYVAAAPALHKQYMKLFGRIVTR
jgi:myo-inositol-1(or 4)-monophosphatase